MEVPYLQKMKPWELLVEEIGQFLGKEPKKFWLVKIWQDLLLLACNCAETIHFHSKLLVVGKQNSCYGFMKIKQFIMIRKYVLVNESVTDFCCVFDFYGYGGAKQCFEILSGQSYSWLQTQNVANFMMKEWEKRKKSKTKRMTEFLILFHANVWYHKIIGYLLCLGQDTKDLYPKYNLSFVSKPWFNHKRQQEAITIFLHLQIAKLEQSA